MAYTASRAPLDAHTLQLQEASTRLVTAQLVDPRDDIAAERQRATFDVRQLLLELNGGEAKVARRAELAEALARTSWGDKTRRHFLTREEEYVGGLRAALGIWQKMRQERLSVDDGLAMRHLVNFPGGLELHIGMFIPTLLGQGDVEQQAYWMPQAMSLAIIGTYAQTELGHGTFVRGLETTATYDVAAQEFVLHSPTLTSTKWWPGGLGKTATHAVVMARLILEGKDYGPHAFVVQLRSLDDHQPLPGIEVGDIGPKFGFNSVDNGFMRMDHLRLPRNHMLMRFSQVTPEGKYVPPPPANAKASYATMLWVRADIVRNAGGVLSKAVTIATRYASVRRQTAPAPGERELQVLDYQNVANVLLPLVASAYALHFMGTNMISLYEQFEKGRDSDDFSLLPELHILSSGLKALCTNITADGIEACRRTCGGHGYSQLSGLPNLFQSYVQNVTWEGDNSVLMLQVARHLLKSLELASKGKEVQGSASYLKDDLRASTGAGAGTSSASCDECWQRPEVQLASFRHRATRLIVRGAAELRRAGGNGRLEFQGRAWNTSSVELIRLATAHCQLQLLKNFHDSLSQLEAAEKLGAPTLVVLRQLASLWALTTLETHMGDFLEDGFLTASHADQVHRCQRWLLAALRPNAVALVDAFGLEDYLLHSALGRADGDVYTALLEMAKGSPLNVTQEGPAWRDVLQPVMKAARSKL